MVTLSGRYPLGGSPLVVKGIDLTLEGIGAEGATIDAEVLSRAIEVTDGASLTLRRIHVVNGNATTSGGGLLVHGAGSSLLMEQASVWDSISTGTCPDCIGGSTRMFRPDPLLWPHTALTPASFNTLTTPNAWCRRGHGSSHALLFFANPGGLAVLEGARAVLQESTIADCAAPAGGGVGASRHANVTLQGGSRIERCNASLWGGGIVMYRGSHVEMDGSVIRECHAFQMSGGFDIWGGGSTLLARNSVRGATQTCKQRARPPCVQHFPTSPAPRQTVENCTAEGQAGAGGLWNGVNAMLIDCRVLHCHSSNINGGITVMGGSFLEMIRGTVTGCTCNKLGGAMQTYTGGKILLVEVLIADCQTTGDQNDGGGIHMLDGTVTMRGGAIRNCEALNADGGALAVKGAGCEVQLSGVTVHGCRAVAGGFLRLYAGTVRLADVSIEECNGAVIWAEDTVHAERVRVVKAIAMNLYGTSSWTGCTFSDGNIWIAAGTHTFTRTTFARYGLTIASGSIMTMLDSHFSECTGHYLSVEGGTMVLRNTAFRNCSTPEWIWFSAEAATNFRSELLTLEPSCNADPSTALISVDSSFTEPLNVRGLRVVLPVACASSSFSVFSDHLRLLHCSDGDDVCGGAATCTNVQPLLSAPGLMTVDCSCQGEFFPNPNGTSLALAPYGFDPSTIELPDSLDPTTIGLPGATVDYCVRSTTRLEPAREYLAGRPFPS